MAERSIIDILLRARGGRQVAAETNRAERGLRGVGTASRGAARGLATVGSAAGVAGVALGYGLYRGGKASVQAFMEAETTARMTANAIKSTGGAANLSSKQILGMADSLSRVSGFDDEAIAQGENLLLTFTKVRGDIFKETSKAAVDMAAFFTANGKPMEAQAAFLALGKAMNDPMKGLTKLSKQGVSFTDQQIKQVEAMTKVGDTAGAQRVILGELQTEYGGAGKTYGNTLEGQFKRVGVAVGNVQEQIGGMLAPMLRKNVLPLLRGVSGRLESIAGNKDLDLSKKLTMSWEVVKRKFRPLARTLVGALRDADLGGKVRSAIEAISPHIAAGFAASAPAAAKAFGKAFLALPLWGMLFTAGWLATKFTPAFSTAGKTVGGRFAMGLRAFGWAGIGAAIVYKMGLDKQIDQALGKAKNGVEEFAASLPGLFVNEGVGQGLDQGQPGRLAPKGAPNAGRGGGRQPTAGASSAKPRLARSGLVAEGTVPVVLNLDGMPLAESQARITVRKALRA